MAREDEPTFEQAFPQFSEPTLQDRIKDLADKFRGVAPEGPGNELKQALGKITEKVRERGTGRER
jgi:hypothetical protein